MSGKSNVAAGRRYTQAVSQAAVRELQRFDSLECWNGFVAGDPVKVRGIRGSWRFSAFITNRSNGANWVEVAELTAGGDAGDGRRFARTRAFDPDRILPVRRRKRREDVRGAPRTRSTKPGALDHPAAIPQRLTAGATRPGGGAAAGGDGAGGELAHSGHTLEVLAPNDLA